MPATQHDTGARLEAAVQDPELCAGLLRRLETALDGASLRFMEVCGTHTVSIFQSGLRSLLPGSVTHLSGPGCPVCVTHDADVAAMLDLAGRDGVIFATFGDLLRVPGPDGRSHKHAQAAGARVAASVLAARAQGLRNFSVLSMHKLVPPALRALADDPECKVEAFLLPGHVATVIGLAPFRFLAQEHKVPAAVGGFAPADILLALCEMAEMRRDGAPAVVNAYPRAVDDGGNTRARALMDEVFAPGDALWRGLGRIPESGLGLRPEFADFDAAARFGIELAETAPIRGCRCGAVLRGRITPRECPLFGKVCTPASPVGPCMVSTEGSCAAYFKYGGR